MLLSKEMWQQANKKGDLSVVLRQLKQGDLVVNNLTLDSKGSEKQHTLKIKYEG